MRILAIETSCDETGIALLEANGTKQSPRFRVLANVVSSQIKVHRPFGGVVPNLAKREHQKNLIPALVRALRDAGLLRSGRTSKGKDQKLNEIFDHEPELLQYFQKEIPNIAPPKIDAIAVTYGPGLAPALWTGVNFAKALALIWKKPLIPVNHLAGHIYVNLLKGEKISFPALALIVSGGHTELVLMKGHNRYQIIGETRDDAAGEAFDKVAKLMELGYPGGPIISRLAESGDESRIPFPSPMIGSRDFDFSFSGLKTAVLYKLHGTRPTEKTKQDVSASFQKAVVDVLVAKTLRAAREYNARTVILGGGVAANKLLREELTKAVKNLSGIQLLLPSIAETTDNALMIAVASYFENKKIRPAGALSLRADPGLRLGR